MSYGWSTKNTDVDHTHDDYLSEFLNEDWLNENRQVPDKSKRTPPTPQAGVRKQFKKAHAKTSRDRVFKHPDNRAIGISMAQKKDAKERGFSNYAQMKYAQSLNRKDKENEGIKSIFKKKPKSSYEKEPTWRQKMDKGFDKKEDWETFRLHDLGHKPKKSVKAKDIMKPVRIIKPKKEGN